MRANGPAPLMPGNLTVLMIVPERIASSAVTADFNAGTAAIGSGPYRLHRYVPGISVDLTADAGWWQAPRQGAEPWPKIEMRVMNNDASRVAALLAGDLDLVEGVPPADAAA